MRRRTRSVIALGTAAILAVPLAAAPASATPVDPLPRPVHDAVAEVLADVAHERRVLEAQPRTFAPEAAEPGWRATLDQTLDEAVTGPVVGVTARLETPDLDWRGSAGQREHDRAAPARPQDRFRAASITKPMIATLVLQEVEAGTWSLDTGVDEVLPGLLDVDVTIEELLAHRSGLPDHLLELMQSRLTDPDDFDEQWAAMGQEYTAADHVAAIRALPRELAPDEDFLYSNAGYVVLRLMLEEATGERVDDLLEKRVFKPARMRHTDYPQVPGTRGPFLVGAAYTGPFGAGMYSLPQFHPSYFDAAGAVTTTTADLHAFTDALLGGRLLEPATVADMIDPRADDFYGLGIYRLPDPCVPGEYLYGHDGAGIGSLSMVLTSADGERQLSYGLTGRDYTIAPDQMQEGAAAVLNTLAAATC
ncbi:serine hydrolase domain-containing protein [Isoptericola croceus]|uniref:serine hydrolase domain-containing protein n=1 Tax=Isoptericola croceus TaxID=3031406 RepID=UPI0023F89B19|nr:serine hydrolase domain-containing protein [Isoptericola croceus]